MGEQTEVTVELVERKIATYVNVGNTVGPRAIIDLLRSRCSTNAGRFATPEELTAEAAEQAARPEEPEAAEAAEEPQEEPGSGFNGLLSGLPGTRIAVNGVLDLRGVPAEKVATVERLAVNGVVLVDAGNRDALSGANSQVNGVIATAPPEMRILVQPEIEFTKASVEAMAAGQKLMVVGNIFFRPDVPAALAAEKFAELRLIGIIIMPEGVQGALLGKMESTGVTILLPEGVTEVVRSVGDNTWTGDYLSRLPDGTAYVNVGNTTIS
jgi:hypothetical protein